MFHLAVMFLILARIPMVVTPDKIRPISDSIPVYYEDVAKQIMTSVLRENDAYKKLEELCDDIGPRLSGSAALDQAILWAVETLKRDGQENVHTESVMVPKWVRGNESLTMIEPRRHEIKMLGLGGSVGTGAEGIKAEVVVVHSKADLDQLGEGAQGKIVLFNTPMPSFDPHRGTGYGETVRYRAFGALWAQEKGAVAALVRSVTAKSLHTPHTGGMTYNDPETKAPLPIEKRIPTAAITIEDAELIDRLYRRGKRIVLHLNMEAKSEGLTPSANVIAELRGQTHPEEIVLMSGHLDSWDVGQGAQDDGGGCVIAMEALHSLRKLGLIPKRTIRVVLWTNEENGTAGVQQYIKDHLDELPLHVAAIESDSGIFDPYGFAIDLKEDLAEKMAITTLTDLLRLLKPLGATHIEAGSSAVDVSHLVSYGIPALGFEVEASKYFDYHHSHVDTLDKVDPNILSRCSATMSIMAYILAEMPYRLGERE